MMKQSLNDDDAAPLVVVTEAPSHKQFVKDNLLPIFVLVIYFVISTALPLYTKELYVYYHYPLTATVMQVAGALVALIIFNFITWYRHHADLVPKSWIFNSLCVWKSLVIFPTSILFALIIALTNIAIFFSPIDLHVLLKSTNIIWIVIFAWIIEKERPTIPIMICVAGLIAGSVLIGYQFSKKIESPAKVILMNLFTFFIEAVMVVVIKKVIGVLQTREPTIKAYEITLTKMWQALILLILPMYLIEDFHGFTRFGTGDTVYVLVGVGVFITVAYQTTVVGLSFFSLATTLGVLGQITIVPQTIVAMLMVNSKNQFSFTPLHIVGAVIVVSFSVAFGVLRYFKNRQEYLKRREFLVPKASSYGTTNYVAEESEAGDDE